MEKGEKRADLCEKFLAFASEVKKAQSGSKAHEKVKSHA